MRRALIWVVFLTLALAGFYIAWPAWTARRIKTAIDTNDTAALERTIDFARVRERAKATAAAEMRRSLERLQKEGGSLGAAIAGQLQGELGSRLANAAVDSILTPKGVIELVRQGRDWRRIYRQIQKPDAPGGDNPGEPAPSAPKPPEPPGRLLSFSSIKSYRLTGPTSIAVGLARDKAASEPELTAELAFTGGDWKVVGLIPRT